MNVTIIVAVLIIGFAAGLRSFAAPAVVAWAAHLGCIDLSSSPFAFLSSYVAVALITLAAVGEFVGDLLPRTPARTAALGLIARFVTGSFSAACLLAAAGQSLGFCLIGGVTAIFGAFAGYQVRTRLVRALDVNDAFIAIPEDLIAVAIAMAAVCIIR